MMKHLRRERFSGLAVALFAAVLLTVPGSARAAPQMLGLVATADATPLQCGDGVCVGFFSAFCLEEDRRAPGSWTAYRPVAGSPITLIVETADGRIVRLPAQDYATFKTRLDFTSVLARVALSRLAAFKPVRLRIAVGPMVSLLPETREIEADLLATVTGPYRRTGGFFFDDGRGRSGAVAMVTRMINLMPRRGRLPKAERRAAYLDTRAAGAAGPETQRFAAIIEGCESLLAQTAARGTMRECLEYRHGIMQIKTNKEFWKALGGV